MISCTEFIPAYSQLFDLMEELGGFQAVKDYWECIAKEGLRELESLVRAHGLRGCFEYWSHTLNEEAADFTMTLDEEAGVFTIEMRHCPSKGRLLDFKHIRPYPNYCWHCDLLYRRVLEKMGYTYEYDLSRCDAAACAPRVGDPSKIRPAKEQKQ